MAPTPGTLAEGPVNPWDDKEQHRDIDSVELIEAAPATAPGRD